MRGTAACAAQHVLQPGQTWVPPAAVAKHHASHASQMHAQMPQQLARTTCERTETTLLYRIRCSLGMKRKFTKCANGQST